MLVYPVRQLEKYRQHPLQIEQTLNLQANLQARDPQVLAVDPVKVKGEVGWEKGLLYSQLVITTNLTYPSTRSLQPVVIPIKAQVKEFYSDEANQNSAEHEEDELIIPLENNCLDLQAAIEDNILLNIPTQVLTNSEKSTGSMPSGNDWNVISEEQYQQNQKHAANPQWDKLKKLLPPDEK